MQNYLLSQANEASPPGPHPPPVPSSVCCKRLRCGSSGRTICDASTSKKKSCRHSVFPGAGFVFNCCCCLPVVYFLCQRLLWRLVIRRKARLLNKSAARRVFQSTDNVMFSPQKLILSKAFYIRGPSFSKNVISG